MAKSKKTMRVLVFIRSFMKTIEHAIDMEPRDRFEAACSLRDMSKHAPDEHTRKFLVNTADYFDRISMSEII